MAIFSDGLISGDDSDASDIEELRADFDEACDEVVELERELRAAKLQAQQLRQRLRAAASRRGAAAAAPQPTKLPAAAAADAAGAKADELQRLLEWIARHADLVQPVTFDVGFEVPIAGRTVHLRRVVQWRLPTAPGSRLRLTVPAELHGYFAHLLNSARGGDRAAVSQAAKALAESWDLVAGELTTTDSPRPEPSVLLADRSSARGVLVAAWPAPQHPGSQQTPVATASGALRQEHPQESPPKTEVHADTGQTISADKQAPSTGDRVEVEYEGRWYTGVLHFVDHDGKASVRCDVDAPGVLTVAPVCQVRRAAATCNSDAPADDLSSRRQPLRRPSSVSRGQSSIQKDAALAWADPRGADGGVAGEGGADEGSRGDAAPESCHWVAGLRRSRSSAL